MSGNEARLLLIAVSNDVDRKIDANLTSFVGILSVPDVVLVLRNFGTKFTSWQVTYLAYCKAWLELKWLFGDILFLISIMLEWFSYFLIMLCNTSFLSKSSLWQTNFYGFLDSSIMLIKMFCQALVISFHFIITFKHNVANI